MLVKTLLRHTHTHAHKRKEVCVHECMCASVRMRARLCVLGCAVLHVLGNYTTQMIIEHSSNIYCYLGSRYAHLLVCLSVHPSIRPSVILPVCLSVCLSVHPSYISLSVVIAISSYIYIVVYNTCPSISKDCLTLCQKAPNNKRTTCYNDQQTFCSRLLISCQK